MLNKLFSSLLLLSFALYAQDEELIVGNCNDRTLIKSSTGYLMALSARQKNNQVFGINQNIQDLLHQIALQKSTTLTLNTRASSYFDAVDVPMDFSQDFSCPEKYRQSTQGLDLHSVSSSILWKKSHYHLFYGASTTGSLMVSDQRLQGMGSMGLMMLYSVMNYIAPVLSRDPFGNSIGFSAFPDWMIGGGATIAWVGVLSYGYISSSGHMLDLQSSYKVFANTILNGSFDGYRLLRLGIQDILQDILKQTNSKIYYQDIFLAAPPIIDSLGNPTFDQDLGENLRGVQAEYIPSSGPGGRFLWAIKPSSRFQAASALWIFQSGTGRFAIEYGLMHTPDLYFYGIKPKWLHTMAISMHAGQNIELLFGKNSIEQFAIFPYSQDSWYMNYRMQW